MGVAEVFVPGKSQSKIFKQWHIVGKYNEVIDLALGVTFTLSSGGVHTPRMCLLRSMSAVLCSRERLGRDRRDEGLGTGCQACSSAI